jgi:serine/threonine protein kinase
MGERCINERPSRSTALWDEEFQLRLSEDNFAIVHNFGSIPSASSTALPGLPARSQWREHFKLGSKLGNGAQATVYRAVTAHDSVDSTRFLQGMICDNSPLHGVAQAICQGCIPDRGRSVAVKLFHRLGSESFHKEKAALLQAGAHPHVARLLEGFVNDANEDVLLLELFDCDLYELYRQWFYHMSSMLERIIGRLIGQLLAALEHLVSRGVCHRDIKLENIMIYNVSDLESLQLKLGDFGWAGVAGTESTSDDGPRVCGTLWYAPPELSPRLPGSSHSESTRSWCNHQSWIALSGKSDMWSVGVVAYLLHVGQNPFRSWTNHDEPSEEALKRAAEGNFNVDNFRWEQLPPDTRSFIESLLIVDPLKRPTPAEAMRHPYILKSRSHLKIDVDFYVFASRRHAGWQLLDGFQRLGWLAMARAVAEPELDRDMAANALQASEACSYQAGFLVPGSEYLVQLAQELASLPYVTTAWDEVLKLAFRYLDVDENGVLDAQDIASHLAGASGMSLLVTGESEKAQSAVDLWIKRWRSDPSSKILRHLDLRSALLASGPGDSGRTGGRASQNRGILFTPRSETQRRSSAPVEDSSRRQNQWHGRKRWEDQIRFGREATC